MANLDICESMTRMMIKNQIGDSNPDAATKYYRKYGISDALFSNYLVNSKVRTN